MNKMERRVRQGRGGRSGPGRGMSLSGAPVAVAGGVRVGNDGRSGWPSAAGPAAGGGG
jgi:hypothetical protein